MSSDAHSQSCGRTIAFLPLRGGSKGIPHKNIMPLAGRPLAWWVLDAAVGCQHIDHVFVATDDESISACVRAYNSEKIDVVGRSPETATDIASTESALLEFAAAHDFERIVLLQATSPLLRADDLEAAFETFQIRNADTLLSVVRQKRFLWQESADGVAIPTNYDPLRRPRRQDFEGFLVENGAFYIMTRSGLLASSCRLHGRMAVHEMREEAYWELDEPADWRIVEGVLETQLFSSRREFPRATIRMFVTDVDGVLTDAGMYYGESGDELKKFNTRDGLGMRLLQEAGIIVGIMTTEDTGIVTRRAAKLKVDFLRQGVQDKLAALTQVCEERGVKLSEVAYIGDDLNDLTCLQAAGWSASPADAVPEVKAAVHTITTLNGGKAAVREFANMILADRKERVMAEGSVWCQ